MRAAIYTRVSTASRSRYGGTLACDQNPEVQEAPLRRLIEQWWLEPRARLLGPGQWCRTALAGAGAVDGGRPPAGIRCRPGLAL